MMDTNQDSSLVFRPKDVDPHSQEGGNEIIRLLNDLPIIETQLQEMSVLSPYAGGMIDGRYLIRVQPQTGFLIVEDQASDGPEYTFRYSTIEGAVCWLLCLVGYGNNQGDFEAVTMTADPAGEFPGIYSAMEEELAPREMERYRTIIQGVRDNFQRMKQIQESGGEMYPTDVEDGELFGEGEGLSDEDVIDATDVEDWEDLEDVLDELDESDDE